MREFIEEERGQFLALVSETGLSALLFAIADDWQGRADALLLEAALNYDSEKQQSGQQWQVAASQLRDVAEIVVKPFDEVICAG